MGGILSLQRQRELEAEGKDHPFIPIVAAPQEAVAVEGEEPPEKEEVPVVMGKIPDGWSMKKDKKKGRW